MTFDVIDLFAGPGGLGEGFATAKGGGAFRIVVSAEMERSAHSTLTLRSFFRHAKKAGDQKALKAYYDFCNSGASKPPTALCTSLWRLAQAEAKQLTLGTKESDDELDRILARAALDPDSTVLIGGPPCQAYSLVGRARNKGTAGYIAEADGRHFLYREYLRILANARPAVFVMENVKGILSSAVGGRRIFSDILRDLSAPSLALKGKLGSRYTLHSLVTPTTFISGMNPDAIDAADFIVRTEEFGVPQARHRVILVGVREDIGAARAPQLLRSSGAVTVRDAIGGLPALRSRLNVADDPQRWLESVRGQALQLAAAAHTSRRELAGLLRETAYGLSANLPVGDLRLARQSTETVNSEFFNWIRDDELKVWLNHQARSHMASDLGRYFYAAVYAQHYNVSPKGHLDFNLPGLAPAHKNWQSGKFADRFRVQRYDGPSTTVTSHISKDGHYFIHPSALQCRSLTVREAARLQSFPDNYFFQGNRTQQYHQVGNAVPPLLAAQIANAVAGVLQSTHSRRASKGNEQAIA